jgi:two-component system cell cycle sensor histidine kinase/response regulator CckA
VLMQGTTFRVYLPALPASIALAAAVSSTPAVRGGHEIILLVEDDPALLSASQAALEHYGYRVFSAATAAAGLTLWKQEQGAVDLLLTDLVMPGGMSGRELADHLLKVKPDLKVIYTSGYSEDIVLLQSREDTDGRFLQKPYAMRGLVLAVRSRLDSGEARL